MKARKLGNNREIRTRKSSVEEASVEAGSTEDLSSAERRFGIDRAHPQRYELQDLLGEISEGHLRPEIAFGLPKGKEFC